ncbi:MAG: COX15/CtaA family protein [Candidatus Omnitrophica bacterium]|nr:COX15/CtaA family protein [Candidatus Omnitrophota bacterium]
MADSSLASSPPRAAADLLAVSFGTTVILWMIGYICRMPPAWVPSPIVLILMVACLLFGGVWIGRTTPRGWKGGLQIGLLASFLNLLVLGSVLTDHAESRGIPTVALWLPGWFLLAALLGAIGAGLGALRPQRAPVDSWTGRFAQVGVGATFLLLVAGGLVTSKDAGLAVVDWPNSFGYNMFLYPLSRMTGGVYYEHAHRLFGSLVGLTTLCLAVHLWLVEDRRWLKGLALVALLAVIAQGVMGGLRVTGRFTLSASPEDTAPNLLLAAVHGVFGQVFFALMGSLAVLTSHSYRLSRPASPVPTSRLDIRLADSFVVLLFAQIILGAIQRHYASALISHLTLASIATLVALVVGIRGFALHPSSSPARKCGVWLIVVVGLQLISGFGALLTTLPMGSAYSFSENVRAFLPTLHQALGAILLALSVALAIWVRREMPSTQSAGEA